jgi:hypothetical protein
MKILQITVKAFFIFISMYLPLNLTAAANEGSGDQTNSIFQTDDAEVLIMSLRLVDGSTLSEDFLVYPKNGQHYFRFQDFCNSAGILCENSEGSISGFLFREAWKFKINCRDKKAEYRQKAIELTLDLCAGSGNETYLSIKALEELFSLQIESRFDRSEFIISSDQLFPAQEKKQREKRAIEAAKQQELNPSDIASAPSTLFNWGPIDLRVSSRANNLRKKHRPQHAFETTQSFEVVGMDFFQYLASDTNGVISRRKTLQKVDTYGRSLPLGIRDIKLIDVETPALPLIGSRSGRGLYLASFGPSTPDGFDSHNFRGFLPNGWEVELYQNGLLIARQGADDKGFYEFNDVSLTYGGNQFRLVFYGPQGQTYEEYKIFNIEPDMTRKGDVRFQAGFVKERTISADIDEAGTMVETSFSSLVTLSLGGVSSRSTPVNRPLRETRTQYATFGIRGFLPGFFWRIDSAWQDKSGSAKKLSFKIPIDQITTQISASQLDEFSSKWFQMDGIGLRQQYTAGFTWSPRSLPLYMSAEGKRNIYVNRDDLDFIVHRLGTAVGSFYLTHEWQREIGSGNPFMARFAANYLQNLNSVRGEIGYNNKDVIDATLNIDRSIDQNSSLGINNKRLFVEGRSEIQAYYNLSHNDINWQSYIGWNTINKEFIGASLATSLGRYKEGGKSFFQDSLPLADGASLTVRIFIDKNNNMIFDEGELPLPGVYVLHNGQRSLYPSDQDGIVRIPRIPAYVTTQITADIKTVEDPLLLPHKQTIWIEGRRGPPLHLDYPFGFSGEVDGYIYQQTDTGRTGMPDIKIVVKDSQGRSFASTKSFSDGYYLLQGLKPGTYSVSVDDPTITQVISPKFIRITISDDGGFVTAEPFIAQTSPNEH